MQVFIKLEEVVGYVNQGRIYQWGAPPFPLLVFSTPLKTLVFHI
jgi:hypothetical protein